MNQFESSRLDRVDLPKDLFEFDYGDDGDTELSDEDKAKQITPKILKFLETLDLEGKKKAMELLDQELYKWGLSPEESMTLARSVYKEMFLAQ